MSGPGTPSGQAAMSPSAAGAQSGIAGAQQQGGVPFRPLNVKDALSYLDRVKVTFNDQPEVYDRFLTIMKDFKSQGIDTPGVIERVSTLFRGHPALIQGFNTFLPPGYRIECTVSTPADEGAVTTITVTTPMGMTTRTQVAGPGTGNGSQQGASSSQRRQKSREVDKEKKIQLPPVPSMQSMSAASSSGIATPGAVSLLSNHMAPPSQAMGVPHGQGMPAHGGSVDASRPPMEFNHAINYVNKIKNRFVREPDTYKAFLEILQTYQKEGKAIQDVYAQVTTLFQGAPDLLDEFKQFLPDTSAEQQQATMSAMLGGPPPSSKRPADRSATGQGQKKKSRSKPVQDERQQKTTSTKRKAERPQEYGDESIAPYGAPHVPPYAQPIYPVAGKYPQYAYSPPPPPPPPQPLVAPKPAASAADLAFFGRVQTYISDQPTYHEFLKLLNLYTQDIIDLPILMSRAWMFIGNEASLWRDFREIVGWTEGTAIGTRDGVEIKVIDGVRLIENVPLPEGLRRGRADAVKGWRSHGPSYRQLPPTEISLACSGRDSLCWEVLNDEWISLPNYANDEGFVSKRLNPYEEALQRSEDERHEYDYHIEAVMRTIALMEPIATRIAIMDAEERSTFRLKPGLGNQSKSIYQRVIKKIYGKEQGAEVIQALHDNPCVAVPIVLARLKQKEEEWKRAMREWNRVWKDIVGIVHVTDAGTPLTDVQDAKNFLKALDHQAISLRVNDKRTLNAKALVSEIETIRREQKRRSIGPHAPPMPHQQLQYKIADGNALVDAARLLFSFLDRANSVSIAERERIDAMWRQLIPLVFALSADDLGLDDVVSADDVDSVDAGSEAGTSVVEDAAETTSNATTGKKGGKPKGGDLRKRAIKNTQGRGRGGKAGSKFGSPSSSRGGSPALSSRSQMLDSNAMEVDSTASTPAPAAVESADTAATVEGVIAALNAEEQNGTAASEVDAASTRTTPEPVAPVPDVPPAPVVKTLDLDQQGKIDRRAAWNTFVGSSMYSTLRMFQVVYQRLAQLKRSAIVVETPVAPEPISLKHVPSLTSTVFTVPQTPENAALAATYYLKALAQCERFFDGDLNQDTFEDSIRAMFGNQAYILFGIDKILHSITKLAQGALSDEKVSDLVDLLSQDRSHPDRSSPQQQTFYRTQAESILGTDENLYRIEWRPREQLLSFQLIGKDSLSSEDQARAEREWAEYIDAYVSAEPTPGLHAPPRTPLLKRLVRKTAPDGISDYPANLSTISSLQSKICVRSYRMFFVTGSEDLLFRRVESAAKEADVKARKDKKRRRFEGWLEKKGKEVASLAGEPATAAEKAVEDVKMDTK